MLHAGSRPAISPRRSTSCSSRRRSPGCSSATAPGSPWVFITAAVSLIPLAGLIGLGTEQLARRSGPALGRLPQRDVRQRRRADHRARRAAQRATSSWSRRRSPAASSATCCWCSGLSFFVGGLGRTLAEVPPHRRHQHGGDAVSRRRRAGDAGGVRPVAVRQPRRASAGDRSPQLLERDRPDRAPTPAA